MIVVAEQPPVAARIAIPAGSALILSASAAGVSVRPYRLSTGVAFFAGVICRDCRADLEAISSEAMRTRDGQFQEAILEDTLEKWQRTSTTCSKTSENVRFVPDTCRWARARSCGG